MNIIKEPGRIAVISPHLDDAVFGCGALLSAYPGSVVITVFAGIPRADAVLVDWDTRCGFPDGAAAMTQRRAENGKALRLLGAEAMLLDFLDDQYVAGQSRAAPKAERIRSALAQALDAAAANTVVLPLGLFHSDNLLAADAALALAQAAEGRTWVAYEEALYRNKAGLLQGRLVHLYTQGIRATPVGFAASVNIHRKATAVAAYTSQLTQLGLKKGEGDPAAPERYWLLQEAIKQEMRQEK